MNLSIALEHRFYKSQDGAIWTRGNYPYRFWKQYLDEFEHVTVIGRVASVVSIHPQWQLVEGPGVTVHSVPDYQGLRQFGQNAISVLNALRRSPVEDGSVLLRVPGNVSSLLRMTALSGGMPFGVEVVGDPWEVLAPGVANVPMRPVLRQLFTARLKRLCREASAVSYVNTSQLPLRYPASADAFATHYSSIELLPEHLASTPRHDDRFSHEQKTIITIGTLDQPYKGIDVLLQAFALLRSRNTTCRLVIVGGGRFLDEMKSLASKLGIGSLVEFTGQLPGGDPIRARLDAADLFVLASRTEGLPRSMIEAMAMGLPCIGSDVGGIPELLGADELVPPGDPIALAEQLAALLTDRHELAKRSAKNMEIAKRYRADEVQRRRRAMLQALKYCTLEWQESAR